MAESGLVGIGRRELEAAGCYVFNVHGSAFQVKGTPDCLGSYPIRSERVVGLVYGALFFAIEYKDGDDKELEPLQDYWIMKIRESGGIAAGVKTRAELDAFITLLHDRSQMMAQDLDTQRLDERCDK